MRVFKCLLSGVTIAALGVGFAASADTIAYDTVAGTPGNQNWTGALGLDFDVTAPIRVTRLGVFDDGSNGLASDITVGIFKRDGTELVSTTLTSANFGSAPAPGDGGNQFVSIPELTLEPGNYSVVAVGYGNDEENYNTYGGSVNPTSTAASNGAVSFLNQWRYAKQGSGFVFPTITGSDVLPTRFDAGTFAYVVPVPPAVVGGAMLLCVVGGSEYLRRRRLA